MVLYILLLIPCRDSLSLVEDRNCSSFVNHLSFRQSFVLYRREPKLDRVILILWGCSMFRQVLFVLCSSVMCQLTSHSEITFNGLLFNRIILSLTFHFFTELQPKC